jgi:hypothetical protein
MGHGSGLRLRLRTTGADREVEVSRTGAKEFGDTAVLPEPGGDVPSRGRAFTLPALMTSGTRLRIKEAQRLTLRSGEAVNAVTT